MPPEEDNNENFSAAFDALTEIGKEEPAPAAEAAPATEEPAPATEAAPAEEPSRVAPEAPPPTADKAEDDALLARLAKLVKEDPPAVTPTPAPAAAPAEAVYSEEEQQVLADYEKDWPEVARAEALRRRAEYRDLVAHIFSEVAKEVAPALDLVRSLAQRSHLSDLQEVVTDYEDVRDKVVDWVETQPAYLQQGMKQVIASGTVEEVADLIERFKSATGVSLAPAAPAVPTAPSKEIKAAAASLAPVSGKRTAVPKAEDTNNFEDAFERFANAGQ